MLQKVYGGLKMRWLSVVLFALAAGVFTGVMLLIPAFENTSLQDIGISQEWWLIFAVLIVVNCSGGLEAAAKCFVFFLISQPVVYLVEVLFGPLSMELALYYYKSIWLPITLLTLPGGFIAYFCKKQNAFGAVILALGNALQALLGLSYLKKLLQAPPQHLLTMLVCFGSIFVMGFGIQRKKSGRLIAMVLPFVLLAVACVLLKLTGRTL